MSKPTHLHDATYLYDELSEEDKAMVDFSCEVDSLAQKWAELVKAESGAEGNVFEKSYLHSIGIPVIDSEGNYTEDMPREVTVTLSWTEPWDLRPVKETHLSIVSDDNSNS